VASAHERNIARMHRDPHTYAIIGAAMEVHRELGPGFLEAVYQDALEIELTERGIPHVREAAIPVFYKSHRLRSVYRADFLCYERVVVEAKAIRTLTTRDDAQVIHYLAATRLSVALLINFCAPRLTHQRYVL
jgi:GxxExxY protein